MIDRINVALLKGLAVAGGGAALLLLVAGPRGTR